MKTKIGKILSIIDFRITNFYYIFNLCLVLALIVSLLICIILCISNKIIVKKHINEDQIKNISIYTIKFKEVFVVSLLSIFESILLKIVFL